MWKAMPVALLLAFVVLGCPATAVRPEELSGTWEVPNESRGLLPELDRQAAMRIELKPDGTFVSYQIPGDLLYVTEREREAPVSGSGVWRLRSITRCLFGADIGQEVDLEFRSIGIGGKAGSVPFVTSLYVSRKGAATTLWYIHWDPDAGSRVYFKKTRR